MNLSFWCTCTSLFAFLSLDAQIDKGTEGHVLQWKIRLHDSVVYSTSLLEQPVELDDDTSVIFPDIVFSDSPRDKKRVSSQFADSIFSTVSRNGPSVLDILIRETKNVPDSVKKKDIFDKSLILRGALYNNGDIQSFWLDNTQKNLLALLFQLPSKSVRVGDSWSLDLNLINIDRDFVCDSSRRINNVTLKKIYKIQNDTIAYLKYEALEYISGSIFRFQQKLPLTIRYSVSGIAKFNITKGRWESYDGAVLMHSVGLIETNRRQDLRLNFLK